MHLVSRPRQTTHGAGVYARRSPETQPAHRVVREHVESFLRAADPPMPRFVEREFRAFLHCGVLAHGFARFHCSACGHDRLVAFSCRRRAVCASCGARRMTRLAARLVDEVLPCVPYRQWVLSLPHRLRYRLAYDQPLLRTALGIFVGAVLSDYWRRARRHTRGRGQSGAVTFVQRFGGALNLNPHFHTLVPDGVFVEAGDSTVSFVRLPPPTDTDVARVLSRVHRRIVRMLERRGYFDESAEDSFAADEQRLAACYAGATRQRRALGAERGKPPLRLFTATEAASARRKRRASQRRPAELDGFDLHAQVSVRARERKRLERLLRYCARPPLATERLRDLPDGRVLLALKSPWSDGTSHIAFEPLEFLERLAALTPRPRTRLVLYHGIFAPRAALRARVTRYGRRARRTGAGTATAEPKANPTWADLLRRGLDIDGLACPRCNARLAFVAAIVSTAVARRILLHLGLPVDPVTTAPARAPPTDGYQESA